MLREYGSELVRDCAPTLADVSATREAAELASKLSNVQRGLALILVRNTIIHDARGFREAATVRGLGAEVLICGVASTAEEETEQELCGTRVIRLDPAGELRRFRAIPARI